jgi:hypothetical protein
MNRRFLPFLLSFSAAAGCAKPHALFEDRLVPASADNGCLQITKRDHYVVKGKKQTPVGRETLNPIFIKECGDLKVQETRIQSDARIQAALIDSSAQVEVARINGVSAVLAQAFKAATAENRISLVREIVLRLDNPTTASLMNTSLKSAGLDATVLRAEDARNARAVSCVSVKNNETGGVTITCSKPHAAPAKPGAPEPQ